MSSAFRHVFEHSVLPQFLFPAPPSKYTRDSFPEHLLWIKPRAVSILAHPIPCLWLPFDQYVHCRACAYALGRSCD